MSLGFTTFLRKHIMKAFDADKAFETIMANAGSAKPGSRAWPAMNKSKDEAIGCRWDFGQRFTKDGVTYINLVLQANLNANNESLRKMAAKNSHQKLTVHVLPLVGNKDELEKAFKQAWLDAASGGK